MTTHTHTPGPWESFERTIYAGDVQIVLAYSEFDREDKDNPEHFIHKKTKLISGDAEAMANANLIAASPDLLEALQGMLNWARRVKQLNPGPEISNAVRAIAKAKGDQ